MIRKLCLRSLLALFAVTALACGDVTEPTVALTTFEVEVPADTPQTSNLYVVSEHYSLGETGLKLTRESAMRFRGQAWLPRNETITYTLQLRGPDGSEVNADGTPAQARTVAVGADNVTVPVKVSRWNVTQAPSAEPAEVTFVVTVPANTPEADTVYLAGNQPEFGPWNPKFFALTRGDDGKYRGTVTFAARAGTGVEYKATRGDWSMVEKDESGGEIANRTLSIPREDSTVELTVVRWADL